jgi:hypothetical protein
MLNQMFHDPDKTYSINVVKMGAEEFAGTGGASERTNGLSYNGGTLSLIEVDMNAIAGPLTALTHELAGAKSRQSGGEHDGPAVEGENLARSAFGCSPPRATHATAPTRCR